MEAWPRPLACSNGCVSFYAEHPGRPTPPVLDALVGEPESSHERVIRFDNPDFPYLFVAALQRDASASVATHATVVPSATGPVVLIGVDVLDEPIVRWLIGSLDAVVEDDD
jgi:hypothetical protein